MNLLATMLASDTDLIRNLMKATIVLVVVGLICWLLWWLVAYFGIPEPFNKIARCIIALVAVVFLIFWLLNFAESF